MSRATTSHRIVPMLAALLLAACNPPAPPAAPAAPAPATQPAAPVASAPATAPAVGDPAVPPTSCDATRADWAIGQSLDEALLERARVDAGASVVRSLKPGQMVTMEFNGERLNVDVDADGNVTGVRCG